MAVESAASELPLTGVLVLDLTRVLSGPYAAMILADLGARVIKVERIDGGDDTRHWGPPFIGEGEERVSSYFLSVNRNKESIILDFRDPDDRQVLEALICRADILLENFRTGVMERLGLGPKQLAELNPALSVVSVTGYGSDGPQAHRSGYDQIIQGEAGVMSLTGPGPDQPVKVGVPVGDLQAGLYAAIAALAGLFHGHTSGRGTMLRTSLLSALVAAHTFQGTRWLIDHELPVANGNMHPTVAPYGSFHCRDGQLQLAVGNDGMWRRFAPLIGVAVDDPRFLTNADRAKHRETLTELIEQVFIEADRQVWLDRLTELGIPSGLVRSLDEVYADPQVRAQELVLQLEHRCGAIQVPGPAIRMERDGQQLHRAHTAPPGLGSDTDRIKSWLAGGGGDE